MRGGMGGMALGGRYVLERRLAAGGMGSVYEATDEALDRPVAVKLLADSLTQDPIFVERFRREARTAGGLAHPGITQVYDFGTDAGRHFIVMEFVPGKSLAEILSEQRRLPVERAILVSAKVCDALEHAHRSGIVHRDIKPANIIVNGDDVKITDFGIARAAASATLTRGGSLIGTPQYISPEQVQGLPVGPESDLYALGIVLFEMLTGAPPFTGDTPVAIAMQHVSRDVPPPSEREVAVPLAVDAVVLRATAKEPAARFPDADGMARELRGDSMSAPSPGSVMADAGMPASRVPDSGIAALAALSDPNPPLRHETAPYPELAAISDPTPSPSVETVPYPELAALSDPPTDDSVRGPETLRDWHPPRSTSIRKYVVVGISAVIAILAMTAAGGSNLVPELISKFDRQRGDGMVAASPGTNSNPVERTRGFANSKESRDGRIAEIPDSAIRLPAKLLEETLKTAGFHVDGVEVYSRAPKDTVVATYPSPRHRLTSGQTVILISSKGEFEPAPAPMKMDRRFIGADAHGVKKRLEEDGLDVETAAIESTARKDEIVATRPGVGSTVRSRSVVLIVSSGSKGNAAP